MKNSSLHAFLAIAVISLSGCFDPPSAPNSSPAQEKDGKNELSTAALFNGPSCNWTGGNMLTHGTGSSTLRPGECIYSPDQYSQLMLQYDGRLVLYDNLTGKVKWSRGGNGANYAEMQSDGNFVLYKIGVGSNGAPTKVAIWSTQTYYGPYTSLWILNGNLIGMRRPNGSNMLIYYPYCTHPTCRFP